MKQRTIRKPDMPLQGLPPAPSSAQGEPEREQSPAAAPQDTGARQQPADNNQNQHATLTLVGKQQVIKIPVTKLRVSPFNARKIRPPKRITKIAESMKVEGQVDPLYVYPGIGEDEGYFMVLGGETRRLAALQISKPELDALVDSDDEPEVLLVTQERVVRPLRAQPGKVRLRPVRRAVVDEYDLMRFVRERLQRFDTPLRQLQLVPARDDDARDHRFPPLAKK